MYLLLGLKFLLVLICLVLTVRLVLVLDDDGLGQRAGFTLLEQDDDGGGHGDRDQQGEDADENRRD